MNEKLNKLHVGADKKSNGKAMKKKMSKKVNMGKKKKKTLVRLMTCNIKTILVMGRMEEVSRDDEYK